MLKLTAFLCMIALCAAQPARPVFPETFVAEYEVERHSKEKPLEFGRGHMARDKTNNRAVFNSTYDERKDVDFLLELYASHVLYEIRGIRNEAACSKDPLNSDTLPDYWSWLSLAKYDGQREVRHVTYDFWRADVGGMTHEVGVDVNNTKVPVFYNRRSPELDILIDFREFTAMTPSAIDFNIPKECQEVILKIGSVKRKLSATKVHHFSNTRTHWLDRVQRRRYARNRI